LNMVKSFFSKMYLFVFIYQLLPIIISVEVLDENSFDFYHDVTNIFSWKYPEELNSFWLAPDHTEGHFTLELPSKVETDSFTIINTHNGDKNDRGTKAFELYFKKDSKSEWELIFGGEFHQYSTDMFLSGPLIRFKYLKFHMKSWFGNGGGLQYFSWKRLSVNDCPDQKEWTLVKNKCYKYFFEPKGITWIQAMSNCKKHKGKLATPHDQETNDFLENLSGGQTTWIGGQRTGSNEILWYGSFAKLSYENWAYKQPDNSKGNEYCLQMNHQTERGKWNDIDCQYSDGESYSYICETNPTEQCS